jgi:hypothetical protein
MATYFSINDGYFNDVSPTAFAAALTGGVTGGILGNVLTTTYSHQAPLATSNGSTFCGVALQLSAVNGAPTGTIDLILSGTDGQSRTNSYPVSGLTLYTSTGNIVPGHPQGWQYFALSGDNVTYPAGTTFRVSVKTSVANKVSLIGATLTNLNREYITTNLANPTNSDTVHIVGTLRTTELDPIIIDYNMNGLNLTSLYVHNGGTLNFVHDSTLSLTITSATVGMQITPNGTVNIGTPNNPVASDKVHTINLSSSFINVHNGATFNAYGAYKTPYALLSNNASVSADNYFVSTDISNWIGNSVSRSGGDILAITPNTSTFTTFDTTTAKVVNPNSLSAWSNSTFSHNSSNYIPSIVNMTRNVRFEGTGTSRGYIRFLDGSVSNLNNTQFKGLGHTTYKGLQFGTNSSGSVSLSNCAFNGDRIASAPAFTLISTKSPVTNISIKECSFYNYGTLTDIVSLASISANNFVFTDNIVLSASQNGMFINALSSTYANIKNNFLIGNTRNGLYVANPYLVNGTIGGIGCMNGDCGVVVAGTNNRANYDGLIGLYNTKEGVNILGTIPQLSSTIFSNITANNNKTVGLELSGNINNPNSPIRVNINGVVANNNTQAGFEGYAITGNISAMTLNDNEAGNILVSIGNANITFSEITSKNENAPYIGSFGPTGSLTTLSNSPFVGLDGSLSSNAATTTQYLSVLDSDLTFSGDFTIECFIKTTVSTLDTNARRIFSFGSNVANGLQLILGTAGTTAAPTLALFTNITLIIGSISVADGEWHHVAVSRKNGNIKLFVDGVQDGGDLNDTTDFNAGATLPLFILRYAGAANGRFNGAISNFRITNKTGLYSNDFDYPTSPFGVIPNTTLLVNGTDYANKTYKYVHQFSNVEILSGTNYSATLFNNSDLRGNGANAIKFYNTNFEQFSMDSSTLSSNYEDVGSSSSVDFLQGSYQFNNCTFGTGILSSTLENYQPEVFTENGFVVMKKNGTTNAHSKMLRAGTISLDTIAYGSNEISEKLEPASTVTKLRSGSKMVPVNKGKSYNIGCYVRRNNYTGDAPRLILKRNIALGYEDTVLDTSIEGDGVWESLSGVVPAALDAGIFEVYVDCSGERGCGSINIDNWSLDLV